MVCIETHLDRAWCVSIHTTLYRPDFPAEIRVTHPDLKKMSAFSSISLVTVRDPLSALSTAPDTGISTFSCKFGNERRSHNRNAKRSTRRVGKFENCAKTARKIACFCVFSIKRTSQISALKEVTRSSLVPLES